MSIVDQARTVADRLQRHRIYLVLAESCTAGLVAATLARVPGISQWLCGSAVTYRESTKQQWLDVAADDLEQFSAVSEPVARQMAVGVLQRTAEANVAAAVTGHLGPDAPPELDGVVFVGLARRQPDGSIDCAVSRHKLQREQRHERQQEAAELVLGRLADTLEP